MENSKELLKTMNNALFHRGPNEEGYYNDNIISLGNRRLSILDIQHGGQPAFNEDKSIITVYNGEIYNFKELKRYLLEKGHQITSNCDTQIIPHLYEEYGEAIFELLDGQFAIAIYDKKNEKLILARDHFGIRPLYFFKKGDVFAFASEIKALKKYENDNSIDGNAIFEYFSFGYNSSQNTVFKYIKNIAPGSFMVIKDGIIIKEEKYWDISYGNEKEYSLFKIDELLRNSVEKRLLSDVNLGLLLSGGLDSALIALYIKELGKKVDTFTLSFPNTGFDESSKARSVANYLGIKNYSFPVSPSDILKNIDIIDNFDEPFSDSAALNVFLITKYAKEHVTVLLSGEGGDEIFGGYYTYEATLLNERIKAFYPILSKMSPLIRKMIPVNNKKLGWEFKLNRFLERMDRNSLNAHMNWKRLFNIDEIGNIFPGLSLQHKLFQNMKTDYTSPGELINMAMFFDLKNYLPADLLVKIDRASMMNSIEGRVPFLDKALSEYMFSISGREKVKIFNKKRILKQLVRKKLPRGIVHRPKMGFSLPMAQWISTTLYTKFLNTFEDADFHALDFNKNVIINMLKIHKNGKKDLSRELWAAYVFIRWAKGVGI
ncbi:asparagine synthase (glutamine-hydrolyzing) [bacterium]|nr:asparagine synthase (glutamine-hydrolyzing) [bacterium]